MSDAMHLQKPPRGKPPRIPPGGGGGRHPGGRTCQSQVAVAVVMTAVAMWKHRRELRQEWKR